MKLFKALVSLNFGLGFCLCFSCFEISIKFVVFFVSLALQILFDQQLSTLEFIKDVLEVFRSACVLQSILIVRQFVKFHLIKLLSELLLEHTVFRFELGNLSVVIFLYLNHDGLFLVSNFIIVLLDLNINFDQLFVKLFAAKSSLFQIALQHIGLSLFIVD